jgi:glycosyltransferase involved in cell wall biosynthesis
MSTSRTLSVVVPVYRSATILPVLTARLKIALEPTALPFELILVNDCSPDDSWSRIVALVEEDPRVRGIDLTRNYGQHAATLAGIRAARGDIVITIDDDLQNPPEEIPKLLAKIDEGYDVVYGVALYGRPWLGTRHSHATHEACSSRRDRRRRPNERQRLPRIPYPAEGTPSISSEVRT